MEKLYCLRIFFKSGLISRFDYCYEKSAVKNAIIHSKRHIVIGCELSYNGIFHSMYKNGKLM